MQTNILQTSPIFQTLIIERNILVGGYFWDQITTFIIFKKYFSGNLYLEFWIYKA